MPEFTVTDLGLPRDADPDECIILEGVAHVFGRDDLADQIMAQATIPDDMTLLWQWQTGRPIGRAEATRVDGEEIRVRARLVDQIGPVLLTCPHLALAVRIVGQEGDASTVDYVSVVDYPSNMVPAEPPYRLVQVPKVLHDNETIRKHYVRVSYGDQGERIEFWHRDDPVLGTIFPPAR